MLLYYKIATSLIAPFVPLWLRFRALRGKEEKGRISERFGYSSYGRPKGTLLWIHAASVGEANSVISLIMQLKKRFPHVHILLTTGTVTSAALMKKRLPAGVLHQYAPVDTPEATERFIRHWLPDVAWFVESELWPNLIDAAKRYYCLMALINARMSERSFRFWQKYRAMAHAMLSSFRLCFAQSEPDALRLRMLGAPQVLVLGNLKYDALILPCDEAELLRMRNEIGARPMWLAASTHPGEEVQIAQAHARLAKKYPNLLTLIVPRHPERGAAIAAELAAFGKAALRSQKQAMHADAAFYIADTLGELGLFYRLAEIVFMGGSLVKHGGQNPLEPAQLACALISGAHTHNFKDMYHELQLVGAVLLARDSASLAAHADMLMMGSGLRADMQKNAKEFVEKQRGASQIIMDMFAPVFEGTKT